MTGLHPIDLGTVLFLSVSVLLFRDWHQKPFDLGKEKDTLIAMWHWGKYFLILAVFGACFFLLLWKEPDRQKLINHIILFGVLSTFGLTIGVFEIFPRSIRNGRLLIYIALIAFFLIDRLESGSPSIGFSNSIGLAMGVPLSAFIEAVLGFWMIANPDFWKPKISPASLDTENVILKKKVTSLIHQNNLEGAIQLLMNNVSNEQQEFQRDLTLVRQRLSEITKRESIGILLPKEAMVERTRISKTLSELMERL